MIPFDRSAALYDRLYRDLDTKREVDEVLARIGDVRSVLDLGCGTGRHAEEFIRRGIDTLGVDRSAAMVALARQRGVDAHVADVGTVRLARTFDAAVALFHVFAYATTDEQFDAFVATAHAHLLPGGRFYFDTWSAEAVAESPPQRREKEIAGVRRCAIPTVRGSLVEVRYVYEDGTHGFEELHVVRPRAVSELKLPGFLVRSIARGEGYTVSVLAERQ
jgi:SAM-dependent methyltransferase